MNAESGESDASSQIANNEASDVGNQTVNMQMNAPQISQLQNFAQSLQMVSKMFAGDGKEEVSLTLGQKVH